MVTTEALPCLEISSLVAIDEFTILCARNERDNKSRRNVHFSRMHPRNWTHSREERGYRFYLKRRREEGQAGLGEEFAEPVSLSLSLSFIGSLLPD